ncbi:MAG TPA: hypothetical protein VF516_10420 [Kofleriaceae bacterium]
MTTRKPITLSLSVDSVEQLQRIGAAFFDEPKPKQPLFPFTDGNCLARHESSVVSRLRKRLAEVYGKPVDHRFFEDQYLPDEHPNAALLRLFRQRQMLHMTDAETIESLAKGR